MHQLSGELWVYLSTRVQAALEPERLCRCVATLPSCDQQSKIHSILIFKVKIKSQICLLELKYTSLLSIMDPKQQPICLAADPHASAIVECDILCFPFPQSWWNVPLDSWLQRPLWPATRRERRRAAPSPVPPRLTTWQVGHPQPEWNRSILKTF